MYVYKYIYRPALTSLKKSLIERGKIFSKKIGLAEKIALFFRNFAQIVYRNEKHALAKIYTKRIFRVPPPTNSSYMAWF